MIKLEKLAAKVEELFNSAQTLERYKMFQIDNIVDEYTYEIDTNNRLTLKECVINLGITKANELYRKLQEVK
jgi:hypothetical protein